MTARLVRVLVVDDYRDAVEMWGIYLRSCGYDVLTSEDGRAALRLAQEALPDVVVLDLELPGLSGIEVARALRAHPATARTPLIAATGHSSAAIQEEARLAGFDVILIKPCDPPALVKEIERLLKERTSDGT